MTTKKNTESALSKKENKKEGLKSLENQQGKPVKPVKYVVLRDGYRVSDKEYDNPEDPESIQERDFWKNIALKHSHGEKVEIVPYDVNKHRVW